MSVDLRPARTDDDRLGDGALTAGIIGPPLALLGATSLLGVVAGVFAVSFGVAAHRQTTGRWGIALGIIAVVLGAISVLYQEGAEA